MVPQFWGAFTTRVALVLVLVLVPSILWSQTREQRVDSVMKANKLGKYNPNNRGAVDVPNNMKFVPTVTKPILDSVRQAIYDDLDKLANAQLHFWNDKGVFAPDIRLLRPYLARMRNQRTGNIEPLKTSEDALLEIHVDANAGIFPGEHREDVTMRLWQPGYTGCTIQAIAPDHYTEAECER